MGNATREKGVVSSEFSHKAFLKDHSTWTWTGPELQKAGLTLWFLSVIPRGCWQCEVEGDRGKVSAWMRGSGSDNSAWLEITIWGLEHKQAFMWRWACPPQSVWAPQTMETKYQSKSDRQAAYLYQTRSHCVEEKQTEKSNKKKMAWPDLHSLLRILIGQATRDWQINFNISYLLLFKQHDVNFYCPFHLLLHVSCQLFTSAPGSVGPPAPRACSVRSPQTVARKLTVDVWICSPRTINTSPAPDVVSFYSHQISRSEWTTPSKSPLAGSSCDVLMSAWPSIPVHITVGPEGDN